MNGFVYTSVLKDEFSSFISLRESQGYKYKNRFIWESLDKYLSDIGFVQKNMTAEAIDGWIASACVNLSDRTVNDYLSYYNSFAKYLKSIGIEAFIPEYRLKKGTYMPYIFSREEVDAIFRIADAGNCIRQKLSKVQIPMLLRVLYGCGLRLGEALKLRVSDIDFETGTLYIADAKGNRDRLVPMHESLTDILKLYCAHVLSGKSESSYLFESDYVDGKRNCIGKPRNASWALQNFRRILEEININTKNPPNKRGVCLHCLRHTFAVDSFRKQDIAGIDNYRITPLLSIYLGHHDLTSTQRYLHMTAENSLDIIEKTNEYSKNLFPEVPQ